MARVRSTLVRWASRQFPAIVEVVIRGAGGEDVRVVDKLPVLSASIDESTLDVEADPPPELWLDVDVVDRRDGATRVRLRHGVATTDGAREVVVDPSDVDED